MAARRGWIGIAALVGCIYERDPAYLGPPGEDTSGTSGTTGEPICEPGCDPVLQRCSASGCVCRAGLTDCDGVCVNLADDPQHCGSCTMQCVAGACGGRQCRTPPCDGFPDKCGDSCTDVRTDPLHCGSCDRRCNADELCVAGECVAAEFPNCNDCPCAACGTAVCCPSAFLGAAACMPLGQCP